MRLGSFVFTGVAVVAASVVIGCGGGGGGSSSRALTNSTGGVGSTSAPTTSGSTTPTPSSAVTTPSAGASIPLTPPATGGTTTPPATGGGATTPPATGGGATTPPATGGGTTTPPATGGGATTPPATGGGTTTPPATGGGTTTPPATGGGTTTPPATGGGTTTPPATGGGTTTPPATGPTLRMTRLTIPGTAVMPGQRVASTLRFEATVSPIEVSQVTVGSYGTVQENKFLGVLRAVRDANRNGAYDAGDIELAALPAATANDPTHVITLRPALVVTPGTAEQLLVVADVLFPTPTSNDPVDSYPGQTIVHGVARAADVVARVVGGASITPAGSFPLEGVLVYQINDHVLMTEVNIGFNEYVELFNPTADSVSLADYYLCDYTAAGRGYHLLPTDRDFGPGNSGNDLIVRLPTAASLAPGQTLIVALRGGDYAAWNTMSYGCEIDIFDHENWTSWDTASFPSGSPTQWLPRYRSYMNPVGGTISYRDVPDRAGFRRQGEAIVLFTWDGQSDLVQDVDVVAWGSPSGTDDTYFDKSAVAIDGPDAGTTPSTYLADTAVANQRPVPGPSGSFTARTAVRRVDLLETGQRRAGGNGLTGCDETSEPWATTWQNDYPDPGRP